METQPRGSKDILARAVQDLGGAHHLGSPRAPHVLVVDDEPCLTTVLADLLSDEGYRVTIAHCGPAAFRAAMLDRPTVVLSDIRMPGGDGLAMLDLFTREWDLCDVPVIFFSSAPDHRRAIRMGAYGFIRKPVGPAELLQCVFDGVCTGFMRERNRVGQVRGVSRR
jgi:CheY-like chemotaxis protein